MQFENESPGEAIVVRARPPRRREAATLERFSTRPRLLERPAQPFRAPQRPRHPVAVALSWGRTQILEGFALCGASMYPELAWPTLEPVSRTDPAGASASPGRADGRWNSQPAASREALAAAERRSRARDLVEQAGTLVINRPIQPDEDMRVETARTGGRGWGGRIVSGIAKLWWAMLHEGEVRRMRTALHTLDDRALKDIGISRHEIQHVVRNGRSWS